MKPKVIVITGATAVGKTEIARILLEICPELVFISCDSRKVYRFMDIGTAKPPTDLRPHYRLIDIRTPDKTYSAQEFAIDAEREIEIALQENKFPIVIGGTVLYLKALFEGFFESPPIDPEIRAELEEELRRKGSVALHEELKKVDPETAAKVHPHDWIRITRALEVYRQFGKPISQLRRESRRQPKFEPNYFFVHLPRIELYERINRRVDRMMELGFLDEVKKLLEMGYDLRYPSMNTLGYRELALHLQGRMSLETAVRLTKKRTRIFARRQIRFARQLRDIKFVEKREAVEILKQLVKTLCPPAHA